MGMRPTLWEWGQHYGYEANIMVWGQYYGYEANIMVWGQHYGYEANIMGIGQDDGMLSYAQDEESSSSTVVHQTKGER